MKCYCAGATVPHKKGEGKHCRTRASAAATSTEFTGADSYATSEIIDSIAYTTNENIKNTTTESSSTSYGGYDSSSSSDYGSSSSGSDSYGGY